MRGVSSNTHAVRPAFDSSCLECLDPPDFGEPAAATVPRLGVGNWRQAGEVSPHAPDRSNEDRHGGTHGARGAGARPSGSGVVPWWIAAHRRGGSDPPAAFAASAE